MMRQMVHAFKGRARNAPTAMLVQLGCGKLLVTGPQQLDSKGGGWVTPKLSCIGLANCTSLLGPHTSHMCICATATPDATFL